MGAGGAAHPLQGGATIPEQQEARSKPLAGPGQGTEGAAGGAADPQQEDAYLCKGHTARGELLASPVQLAEGGTGVAADLHHGATNLPE